mmetsp:Transcript_23994/g.51877  ORF Transcript_23994/g.51877 Transcript_23994/m.51877 type:complete len:405 (+) Transcript_23994:1166-2380(+)
MKSKDERQQITRSRTSEGESDDSFYDVQISLLIPIGETLFCKGDMSMSSQIVVLMADNFLLLQGQHAEKQARGPPDKASQIVVSASEISFLFLILFLTSEGAEMISSRTQSQHPHNVVVSPFANEAVFGMTRSQLIVEYFLTMLNEGEMSKLIIICKECDIQLPFDSVHNEDDERNQTVLEFCRRTNRETPDKRRHCVRNIDMPSSKGDIMVTMSSSKGDSIVAANGEKKKAKTSMRNNNIASACQPRSTRRTLIILVSTSAFKSASADQYIAESPIPVNHAKTDLTHPSSASESCSTSVCEGEDTISMNKPPSISLCKGDSVAKLFTLEGDSLETTSASKGVRSCKEESKNSKVTRFKNNGDIACTFQKSAKYPWRQRRSFWAQSLYRSLYRSLSHSILSKGV